MNYETETLAKVSHMLREQELGLLHLRGEADSVHRLLNAAPASQYRQAAEVFRLLAQAQAHMAQAHTALLDLIAQATNNPPTK